MKKISKVLVFVLAFVTFATLESNAQKVTKEQAQVELENGLIKFVNAVRPAYTTTKGMNLQKFKLTLVGKSNAENITPQGNALIAKAFTLISNGSSEEVIKKEGLNDFVAATKYMVEYNQSNKLEIASDKGCIALFGGNVDELAQSFPTPEGQTYRVAEKCRWYQVGCHLRNFWAWLGTITPGDVIEVLSWFL